MNEGMKKPGFTLLEILIAVGVLFIIGAAVVSLSNTLIQGTVRTADTTVTNLWAVEGLELVTKIRDDNYRNPGDDEFGDPVAWLPAARSTANYGWYNLVDNGNNTWALEKKLPSGSNSLADLYQGSFESKTSDALQAKRLVCIEAVKAASPTTDDELRCNTDESGAPINNDGSRIFSVTPTECDEQDYYCTITKDSLNKNSLGTTVIPAGNAVKVRTVLVWPHQNGYRSSSMSMLVTNWRSLDQ